MSYKYLSGLSDNTSVPTGTLPITVSSNNVIGISATPSFSTVQITSGAFNNAAHVGNSVQIAGGVGIGKSVS